MFLDYHTHSNFSSDGKQTICQLCEAAIFKNLSEICVTDHYEPYAAEPYQTVPPSRSITLEIAKARRIYPQLKIKLGFELTDYTDHHDELKQWINSWDLDYFLLSQHVVDGVDPYLPEFFMKYDGRKAAYSAYAKAVLDSIDSWRPREFDCLAHLGYVGRYAPYPIETRAFAWRDAPDLVDAILKSLIEHEAVLEINTSSYRNTDSPIPGPDILKRYKELGGEFVMFGSDAHKSEHVGYAFDRAHALAVSLGLNYSYRFDHRKKEPVHINCKQCI